MIKAIIEDYDFRPLSITYYYFTANDLKYMKERGWEETDEYKRAKHYMGLGYERLGYFKLK